MAILIQLISIFLEAIIVIFCLFAAIKKKKIFAYGFALTFFIYVFYDSVRLFQLAINEGLLYASFFLATISAFVGAILMGLEKEPKMKNKRK